MGKKTLDEYAAEGRFVIGPFSCARCGYGEGKVIDELAKLRAENTRLQSELKATDAVREMEYQAKKDAVLRLESCVAENARLREALEAIAAIRREQDSGAAYKTAAQGAIIIARDALGGR